MKMKSNLLACQGYVTKVVENSDFNMIVRSFLANWTHRGFVVNSVMSNELHFKTIKRI